MPSCARICYVEDFTAPRDSLIGRKQGLLGDERSKLVLHVCRLVEEAKPQYVFLENTPAIILDTDYESV